MKKLLPILLLLLAVTGCGSCDRTQAPPPAPVSETTRFNNLGLDTGPPRVGRGAEAWVTAVSGSCFLGAAGLPVAPGTKIVVQAELLVKTGFADLFFPESGVARLGAGTAATLTWEGATPVLTVGKGEVGVVADAGGEHSLIVVTGPARVEFRQGSGVVVVGRDVEIAVRGGDAKVAAEDRFLFVNPGELLVIGRVPGGPLAPNPQGVEWEARLAALAGITHADEFAASPAAIGGPGEAGVDTGEATVVRRGKLTVAWFSMTGQRQAGACRIYDQLRDQDIFGTTVDFPGDMPVELPAGAYSVQLVYTDIIYPPRENVEVRPGEATEVRFEGFGRLVLKRRGGRSELPLFFRVYDGVTRREVTRRSLELTGSGTVVELLPGTYNVEFIYAETQLPPIDGIGITAGETVTREVGQ